MGATYNETTFPGEMSRNAVKQKFCDLQEQDRYDNGHSYSGGFGMADGLEFLAKTFNSRREAEEYVSGRAQKWEAAQAVTVKEGDGPTYWYVGAWCAS